MTKRVVVTGLGCISPVGNNVPDTWNALLAGKSGAGPITRFDATKYKTRFAAEVKGFDPVPLRKRATCASLTAMHNSQLPPHRKL